MFTRSKKLLIPLKKLASPDPQGATPGFQIFSAGSHRWQELCYTAATMKPAFLAVPLLAIALQAQTGKLMHATGSMDVTVAPVVSSATSSTSMPYPRYSLSKHYHGPLEADATGEMLSGGDPRSGTAGYVAMETVIGTLEGHAGSFQLMQMGTMEAGKLGPEGKPAPPELRPLVVPGSGTGALSGLSGNMRIDNNAGKHTYTLDYTLPRP